MSLGNLQELFEHELMDLRSAEEQLLAALPEMSKKASAKELKAAFDEHLELTKEHVERLDRVAKELDIEMNGEPCKAMEGLIEEGKRIMSEGGSDEAMDAALIAAAQKIEHYEIAGYGTLATYAEELGHDEALKLLKRTQDEEEKTDEKLTKLAKGGINEAAVDA